MSSDPQTKIGTIIWTDLTVSNAEEVRDFYQQVVGWDVSTVDMGDHNDFNMEFPGTGRPAVGICHALGQNKALPPQWLIYIVVENLDKSIAACQQLKGKVIYGPINAGTDRFCVVQDPAGAVAALYEKGQQAEQG